MHAIIFDIDGTLLESAAIDDQLYRQAVANVLGDVSLRPTLHDYDHVSDSGILSQVLTDNELDDRRATDMKQEFVFLLQAHIDERGPFPEIDGAAALLDRLRRSQRHAVAIAIGGWRESAELKLRTAGIDFNGIPLASSSDAVARTAIMKVALQHLGDRFSSVTYYGDGRWDRDASAELGWNFVAVGAELGGLTSLAAIEI